MFVILITTLFYKAFAIDITRRNLMLITLRASKVKQPPLGNRQVAVLWRLAAH